MHLPKPLLFLFAAFTAAWLPARLAAQPLIIVEPVTHGSFNGDASANFTIVATGNTPLTYQWQLSTDSGDTWNNIVSGTGNYSNYTTSALSVLSPNTTLNGFQYRCVVTDHNALSTTSTAANLKVVAAPSETAAVTVTPSSIAANSTANITITISGLSPGDTVRVRRYLDLNSNHNIDTGEPLVQSFPITAGAQTSIGGVVDPGIPGDLNPLNNGTIITHLTLPASPEIGRTSGNYIIHVSSPSGEFKSVLANLTVTQPAYGQSITGQVSSGNSVIANAGVIVLASNGKDQTYIASSIANTTGNYTITAPVGNYSILPFKVGYVGAFGNTSANVTSGKNVTGANAVLLPATATINGQVVDPNIMGTSYQGVQFFVTGSGQAVLATSDSNGAFDVPVTVSNGWDFSVSTYSTDLAGALPPVNDPQFDTSSGSVTKNIPLTGANALIYGSLTNSSAAPLAGVSIEANDNSDNNGNTPQTDTDLSGNYFLLAYGNVSTPDSWYVDTSTDNPALAGYVAPPGQNVMLLAGESANVNFVVSSVTNFFNGTVTNHGTPVPNVQVDADAQINGNYVNLQSTTDANGNFSIGAGAGSWTLSLDNQSASDFNLVGAALTENVTAGHNVNGIIFPVVNATYIISGVVTDSNGDPVTNINVGGFATIGNINFNAGSQTDNNGNYNFPVINGSWDVSVSNGQYSDQIANVNGANQTVNFALAPASVIVAQPQNQVVNLGQSTNFSIGVNIPGNFTLQWQQSLDDGATWSNLTDVSPYNGSAGLNLNISDVAGLNGALYQCLVSYLFNGSPTTVTSDTASLTVQPAGAPSFIQNPVNQTVTAGSDTGFAANATGTPSPSLQWQFSTDGGNTWNNLSDNVTIAGATTTNLVIMDASLAMNGQQFHLFATNSNGNATSNSATLTVNPNQTQPGFSVNPTNQSVNAGQNAIFSATVTGLPTPSLQWQFSTDSGDNWSNITSGNYSGATTSSLSVLSATTGMNGYQYRLFAFNIAGNATSGPATLTVTSNTTAPSIIQNPTNQSVTIGSDTGFAANATGIPAPTLQWQIMVPGNSTWSNLTDNATYAGVDTTNLVIMDTLLTMNGDQFRVFAFNTAGNATSTAATLTVSGTAPQINPQPSGVTVAVGGNATFSVGATGTTPFTYQWFFNNKKITGATNATYVIAKVAASNVGNYTVVVSNGINPPATSQPASLTLGTLPKITTSPSSLTIALGMNASFSVVASGTSPNYQWQGMQPGSSTWSTIFDEDGVINGNNTPTLTFITPLPSYSGGQVRVIVSNPYGTVISKSATLTIDSPANLTAVFAGNATVAANSTLTVTAGNSIAFSSMATGTALKYQWTLNGKNISGATKPTYTIAKIAATNGGVYKLIVTNTVNKVVYTSSFTFNLNVLTPPTIITQLKALTAKTGTTAILTVVTGGNPLPNSFTWKFQGSSTDLPLNCSSNTTSNTNTVTATLTITDVTSGDQGSYSVTVANGNLPSPTSTAKVTVK